MNRLPLAVIAFTCLCLPATAQELNFTFTFTGVSSNPDLSGTISGEIFGLASSGVSTASDIEILSAPIGFGITAPLDFNPSLSSFIVENGSIFVADYDGLSANNIDLNLFDNGSVVDDYLLLPMGGGESEASGPSATTVEYALAPVPESHDYCLVLLAAMAGFIGWKRMRESWQRVVKSPGDDAIE